MDIECENNKKLRPIHTVMAHQNPNIDLEMLIKYMIEERNIDIESKDIYGWKPLHYAVHHRLFDIAKYLIERGADITAKIIQFGPNKCEFGVLQMTQVAEKQFVKEEYDELCNIIKVKLGDQLNMSHGNNKDALDMIISMRRYTYLLQYTEFEPTLIKLYQFMDNHDNIEIIKHIVRNLHKGDELEENKFNMIKLLCQYSTFDIIEDILKMDVLKEMPGDFTKETERIFECIRENKNIESELKDSVFEMIAMKIV